MELTTMLVQPLGAGEQTISLSYGPLEIGTNIIIDKQERCIVQKVLSPTQACVVRGAHGTKAQAYQKGTMVGVLVDDVEAVDPIAKNRLRRERQSDIVLAVPLPKDATSLSISGGTLIAGARIGIDDEWMEVRHVLTPRQGAVQRGLDGSPTTDHAAGTPVEMILPELPRSPGRNAPDISGTTKMDVCPLCGRSG